MFKSLGSVLDHSLRLGLMGIALSWVGFRAFSWLPAAEVPQPAAVSSQSPDEPVNEESQEADSASDSVLAGLASETGQIGFEIAGNKLAHLMAVVLVGLAVGAGVRPRLDAWRFNRAVRAAKRRVELREADLRVLAANDAKDNKPGPNIQPVKKL